MERPSAVVNLEGCESCPSRCRGVLSCLGPEILAGHARRDERPHATGVDCLRAGRVKVYRSAPRDRQHILRIAETGDILALEPILTGKNHTSTAEMVEDGVVCHLNRDTFVSMLESDPSALRAIAGILAKQLLRSEAELVELAGASVPERMAVMLLGLARRYGSSNGDGVRIELMLSREDLAEMIGTTSETAIRQLSELRAEGIVTTAGRAITIEDLPRLAQVANKHSSGAGADPYRYSGRPE